MVREGWNRPSTADRSDEAASGRLGDTLEEYRSRLRSLVEALPPDTRILGLVSGGGYPGSAFLAEEVKVTSVDFADVQFERAQKLVPKARSIRADKTAVDFPKGTFGRVGCRQASIRIPLEEPHELLRNVHDGLAPRGRFRVFAVSPPGRYSKRLDSEAARLDFRRGRWPIGLPRAEERSGGCAPRGTGLSTALSFDRRDRPCPDRARRGVCAPGRTRGPPEPGEGSSSAPTRGSEYPAVATQVRTSRDKVPSRFEVRSREVVVSSPPEAQVGSLLPTASPHEPHELSDPPAVPLSLFGFEFSLDTAPLDALEVAARSVTPTQVGEWFSRSPGTEEVALLSTCHRVELAVLARYPDERGRWEELLPGPRASWRLREGREVVRHLFRVAAGRESLAVGEAEVRHQVRAAGSSVLSRHPRPVLRGLFGGAASAADRLAPSVPASRSIAAIAAARLLRLVGPPHPRVLVIGSGTVGRQVVESLCDSARVTVMFHLRAPEESFLRSTGARAQPLERLSEEIVGADAVITAAKFGNHGLHASDLPRDRPLVLVDLGVPRNIDPEVRELENVRLVDLEELHSLCGSGPGADAEDAQVDELAACFSDRLDRLLLEPWVGGIRRAAEDLRRAELARARSFLGTLEPDQEVALDRLTQRLVARLLLAPTERVRSLPAGPRGDLQRRFALELLRPAPPDP